MCVATQCQIKSVALDVAQAPGPVHQDDSHAVGPVERAASIRHPRACVIETTDPYMLKWSRQAAVAVHQHLNTSCGQTSDDRVIVDPQIVVAEHGEAAK